MALALALVLPVPVSARVSRVRGAETSGSTAPTAETPTSAEPVAGAPSPPSDAPAGEPQPAESSGPAIRERSPRADLARACEISIEVSSPQITAGESPTVSGQLTCEEAANEAEQEVTLYQRQRGAGGSGLTVVGTATTETDGAYHFTPPAIDADTVFYVHCMHARSPHLMVKVAAQVTLGGTPEGGQLFIDPGHSRSVARNTVTFTGSVSPAPEGAIVVLQRENSRRDEHWQRIGITQVGPEGTYSITHTFRIPGEVTVRAIVRDRGHSGSNASEPLSYEVSQRENPRLTIETSADPISDGQPVKITGVVAGAANRAVTLLARTPGNRFATVATGTTDGAGNYTFTESPVRNTIYRVTSTAKKSTPLFEAVKYALATSTPPTAVESGQALTFTGTVVPASPGQPVYLERQNASGTGFDVIDVATVGAGSSFSITDTSYRAGGGALRIKVPGDAENQSAASPLFKVEATPAAAPEPEALGTPPPS